MRTKSWRIRRLSGILPLAVFCVVSVDCGRTTDDRFYATADGKLLTIEVRDNNRVAITPVGPTVAFGCASIARSAMGVLYSMCGPGLIKPGPQQLATLDSKTGQAKIFGTVVEGLQVMGLEFAPDGTLYAVGDANPASPSFNSLYTVDVTSGEFTRIGSTGASPFFMDFAFDRNGTMYGATSQGVVYDRPQIWDSDEGRRLCRWWRRHGPFVQHDAG